MNSAKINELIDELEQDIRIKSEAVSSLKRLLATTNGQRPAAAPLKIAASDNLVFNDNLNRVLFGSNESYVDLAVKLIEANGGRPLSIASIVEQVRTLKGNNNIERKSVEATLYQHSKKAASPRLVKIGSGMYGLLRKPSEEMAG